ncbi:hypothetical protein RO07_10370 [Pandoraea pulmonicola]|uniref:Uncharacterized protein n=1 Tax=Pandoraea pulmonicola TaxID=93221 RepID=A0ABM5RZ61_PANPU|nr:hypothetical protein RO07_10370 [Pandoraea pulmonicola]
MSPAGPSGRGTSQGLPARAVVSTLLTSKRGRITGQTACDAEAGFLSRIVGVHAARLAGAKRAARKVLASPPSTLCRCGTLDDRQ